LIREFKLADSPSISLTPPLKKKIEQVVAQWCKEYKGREENSNNTKTNKKKKGEGEEEDADDELETSGETDEDGEWTDDEKNRRKKNKKGKENEKEKKEKEEEVESESAGVSIGSGYNTRGKKLLEEAKQPAKGKSDEEEKKGKKEGKKRKSFNELLEQVADDRAKVQKRDNSQSSTLPSSRWDNDNDSPNFDNNDYYDTATLLAMKDKIIPQPPTQPLTQPLPAHTLASALPLTLAQAAQQITTFAPQTDRPVLCLPFTCSPLFHVAIR
jgi:hypothetical protein